TEVMHSIVHVSGIPHAKPHEIILFETGEFGQVWSLKQDYVEIIIFSKTPVRVGTKVTGTTHVLEIPAGKELLGKTIDPFGSPLDASSSFTRPTTTRRVDIQPSGISARKRISTSFHTGISLVDLMVPLGK